MAPRPSATRRLVLGIAVLAAITLSLVGCTGSDAPILSFDPGSPCTTNGQQPGAYPELEAMLPDAYDGEAPSNVDSGRTCTADALGPLSAAGVENLRFAGATWRLGGTSGVTMAVFEADGLDPTLMREFYATGADAARRTEKSALSDTTVGGVPGKRLDVLGSDGLGQTVVAWPAATDGRVFVLLAADLGDAKVADILETFGSR